ncbi:unnamed protein product, partial [Mesorhabditis belari]|uniref:Uncharacterized protein n=1 Tax=Mesorhabditis belari TaxID=2138241 RepID=A0AAF3EXJ4_9BILA
MVKLPLPLPNLRNSPMDKICYDVKLEILELGKKFCCQRRMGELPFEMPDIRNFPMEKLCYDLKLEILELAFTYLIQINFAKVTN